jgi:hypothetical protein
VDIQSIMSNMSPNYFVENKKVSDLSALYISGENQVKGSS